MATSFSARRLPIVANSSRTSSSGMPNLLILRPVEMCGWLFASMSGLTRSATRAIAPSRAAIASTRASSPTDSTLIALRPSGTAHSSSAGDLPTPVKTMSAGGKPGLARQLDLPDGVRVGGAAELAQRARETERGIGLERVMKAVWMGAESGIDRAIAIAQHRRAVHVDRGSFRFSNRRQWNAVAFELLGRRAKKPITTMCSVY